jgi:hypothetical protein
MRNHVHHPRFAGSFSLKAVLPALVPEMTYEGTKVGNGTDAGLAWESLVRGNLDGAERLKTEKALRKYCGQDTLALVRLVEKVRDANAVSEERSQKSCEHGRGVLKSADLIRSAK